MLSKLFESIIMKNIFLTFLSLFFLQISQAYFVKIAKDNHMSQPGYITTIYESNVQATAVNSDQTKLFTVFRRVITIALVLQNSHIQLIIQAQ